MPSSGAAPSWVLHTSEVTNPPLTHALPAACPADYEVFYGTASPPTSYGGYGGNAQEDAKYSFEYPTGWKSAQPNKVEKGTQGIDCRVYNVSAAAGAAGGGQQLRRGARVEFFHFAEPWP
jgi:hypothetical protein